MRNMDGLSGWLQSCIVALSILVAVSYCSAAGTCKDGICTGFAQEVNVKDVDVVPPSAYLNEEGTCFFKGTSRAIVPDKGLREGITRDTIKFRPPTGGWYIPGDLTAPNALEYIAKMLSEQRKFGPEIRPEDIVDLVGEAVNEQRKRRETL